MIWSWANFFWEGYCILSQALMMCPLLEVSVSPLPSPLILPSPPLSCFLSLSFTLSLSFSLFFTRWCFPRGLLSFAHAACSLSLNCLLARVCTRSFQHAFPLSVSLACSLSLSLALSLFLSRFLSLVHCRSRARARNLSRSLSLFLIFSPIIFAFARTLSYALNRFLSHSLSPSQSRALARFYSLSLALSLSRSLALSFTRSFAHSISFPVVSQLLFFSPYFAFSLSLSGCVLWIFLFDHSFVFLLQRTGQELGPRRNCPTEPIDEIYTTRMHSSTILCVCM